MTPRSLTDNERGLLELAVASIADPRCREALARQVESLQVVGGPPLFVYLQTSGPIDPGCFPGRNNPVEGTVRNLRGEPVGGILVWIEDGALSALELFSFEDTEPTEFPDPNLVRVDEPGDIRQH